MPAKSAISAPPKSLDAEGKALSHTGFGLPLVSEINSLFVVSAEAFFQIRVENQRGLVVAELDDGAEGGGVGLVVMHGPFDFREPRNG